MTRPRRACFAALLSLIALDAAAQDYLTPPFRIQREEFFGCFQVGTDAAVAPITDADLACRAEARRSADPGAADDGLSETERNRRVAALDVACAEARNPRIGESYGFALALLGADAQAKEVMERVLDGGASVVALDVLDLLYDGDWAATRYRHNPSAACIVAMRLEERVKKVRNVCGALAEEFDRHIVAPHCGAARRGVLYSAARVKAFGLGALPFALRAAPE